MLKQLLKECLLRMGLYYTINEYRIPDERTPQQMAFYSSLIGPQDLVFDVGANIGQRTAIFSKLAMRVVAIEPQQCCLKHLRSRFRFARNVTIESVAVSDSDGDLVLYQNALEHTLSTASHRYVQVASASLFPGTRWSTEVRVAAVTLDTLIARYGIPQFVKIDVEGYELAVLAGLSTPIDCISFEYRPGLMDETAKGIDLLDAISAKYRWNYCLGERLDFVLKEHMPHQEFVDQVLPTITANRCWGDIYAIHK